MIEVLILTNIGLMVINLICLIGFVSIAKNKKY
jgi:hypothetical protein